MASSRIFSGFALAGVSLAVLLTGCGVGSVATNTAGALQLRGSLYGGQQPVSGSSLQLYTAGKTGNGSAATAMLTTPVSTDANGLFSITGDYACANASDQVYIVARGGNPGLSPGTNNNSLVLMTALGSCGNLTASTFISINEVTTAAAVWALAPFLRSASNLGASATNSTGLQNAFLDAQLLASTQTGTQATLPSNLTVESGKLYALANSLASCVNSDGTTGCSPLFSAATPFGGSAPSNTLAAALNIVQNPGNNVAAVYRAASATPPFPSTLTQAPTDWTMSLQITGGGLSSPSALSLDVYGNVWVSSQFGALSGFTPQGTPFNSSGYGLTQLSRTYGVAVDSNGDVWATNQQQPSHSGTRGSVAKFAGAAAATPGNFYGVYYDNSVNYPEAVAADTNGNVMVANYAGGDATVFNTTGTVVGSGLGAPNAAYPIAIAVDTAHGFWIASQGDTTVSHFAADGSLIARPNCCNASNGIGLDAAGNAWVANYQVSTLSEVTPTGAVTLNQISGGGVYYPEGVAVDANQEIWIANYRANTISHFAGNSSTTAAGTPLSPSNGLGLDSGMVLPNWIAVDKSGNLWISDNGSNAITMLFGLAAPTRTPLGPVPTAP